MELLRRSRGSREEIVNRRAKGVSQQGSCSCDSVMYTDTALQAHRMSNSRMKPKVGSEPPPNKHDSALVGVGSTGELHMAEAGMHGGKASLYRLLAF